MKTIIIKLSGKVLDNFVCNDEWIKIIEKLKSIYSNIIIVHGGGIAISEWAEKMDLPVKFINGKRYTDEKMMEVVAAVQAGLLNTRIISYLESRGLNAIGLNGISGGAFVVNKLNEELGFVGTPEYTGKKEWLLKILKTGLIPVFSTVSRDDSGNLVNVNADDFTSVLASVLNVDTVLFLSDVSGVKVKGNYQKYLSEIDIMNGIHTGEISDGMIPKMENALTLLKNGIKKVWIGNKLDPKNFNENELDGTWIIQST